MANKNTPNSPLKAFFEQAYRRKLTDEEVAEFKERLVQFFSVLAEVDRRVKLNELLKDI